MGPLGEFSRVLKKYDNRRDKQLVKRLMFANMVVQPEGDITRYVRDFGSVAGTDAEADFKAAELQAMSELLEKMGPDALTREKVSELRSDGNLVDGFKRAGDRARETVRRVKLMDTPAKKSADCLSELEKILPEMLDVLGPDELEKVRRNLVAVADKVEELIGRSMSAPRAVVCYDEARPGMYLLHRGARHRLVHGLGRMARLAVLPGERRRRHRSRPHPTRRRHGPSRVPGHARGDHGGRRPRRRGRG